MPELRLLYINTHVGQALREGGVAWAVEEFDPDLVVLTEVGRLLAQARVRRLFGIARWSITGLFPRRPVMVESGTLIIAKRSVLKRKWWSNRFLTGQRWVGGRRDKWHTPRRLTRAFFVFAANPSVRLHVGADHAWTHAGHPLQGPHPVPTEYRRQILAYAASAGESVRQNAATVHVGDMNAMTADGDFVADVFGAQGMKVRVRHGLDFLLSNHRVRVVAHQVIPADKVHTDHPTLVVDLQVDAS